MWLNFKGVPICLRKYDSAYCSWHICPMWAQFTCRHMWQIDCGHVQIRLAGIFRKSHDCQHCHHHTYWCNDFNDSRAAQGAICREEKCGSLIGPQIQDYRKQWQIRKKLEVRNLKVVVVILVNLRSKFDILNRRYFFSLKWRQHCN